MEQVQQQERRHGVWFANLSAYNDGRMVGKWVYPLQYDSLESFERADYDDFPNMGEYPDHDELYEMIHAVENSHIDNEILFLYMADQHDYSVDLVEEAEKSFISVYDSWKDFANERAEEDIENTVNKEAVQFVFNNFDYEGYARDLKHSYYSFELSDYSVAIFYQS